MTKNTKPRQDDAEQSEAFIKLAKEVGADERGDIFDRALSIIAPKTLPDKAAAKPRLKRGRPPKEPAG